MAFVIAENVHRKQKDTACVDVCPVDCIHPAKNRDYHGGPESQGAKNFDEVPQLYIKPHRSALTAALCVPVCPVTAYFSCSKICPEKWAKL